MQNQRGFITLPILIAIVLGLIVVGGGAYFVMQQKTLSQNATDTENLDILPVTNDNKSNKSSSAITPTPAQWKTYINSKYGFSIKYPGDEGLAPQELGGSSVVVFSPPKKIYVACPGRYPYSKKIHQLLF